MEIQDSSEQRRTNTNKNNTDMNNMNPILSSEEMGMEESAVNEWTMMYQYFWKQLDFEYLLIDYPLERDSVEEILEILVDTCCSNRKMIRIAGDDKPKEVVKSRLMRLEREHIQYVMKCLDENSTKVRNMKQYVLATLYNDADVALWMVLAVLAAITGVGLTVFSVKRKKKDKEK